ncbi:MAG: rhsA [Myxococcales bacterium]|nr:rhsA [Myxococcales bacterium]
MRSRTLLTALIAAGWLASSNRAFATVEVCGDQIDNDGNGLTDEGCYPTLSAGVCESPLSCGDTGMVSWTTGSLHYDLPPDIAPAVPFGPGIGMRRFYTSMDAPSSNPTSVNHTPLGPHWGHTYLTFAYLTGTGVNQKIVLHTSQGRDVLYTYASNAGGWDSFTPQAGDHVMSLKHNTASPNQFQVQLLTGETIVYNSVGQLTEIWDTLPTPNKVLVTWDSTTNGNVSTVTDANGRRRLLFSYSVGLMTSVQFQTKDSGGTWNTQHTTSYTYNNGATRDATSGWFAPASNTEWTNLLTGTGLSNPSNLWLMQETSGSLANSIGSSSFTVHGTPLPGYAQSKTGWSRKGILFTDGSTTQNLQATGLPSQSSNSWLCFAYMAINSTPSADRLAHLCGGVSVFITSTLVGGLSTPFFKVADSFTVTGSVMVPTTVQLVVAKHDKTNSATRVYTGSETLNPGFFTRSSTSMEFGTNSAAAQWTGYSGLFTGASAELTDAQVTMLMSRLKTGYLTSVTIGGQLAQQFTYDATNSLTKITDGAGNQIAAFSYSSTTAGQVDLVATPRGTVGFEYNTSRSGCTAGNTVLFFNQGLGNATSCSIDSDCGTGYLCGGKTGTGSTGKCFLAGRCMTTGTVNGEQVVTTIAALGPGGGSCTGACLDVAQYVWSSNTALLNVIGRKDPLGNYTSAIYNSNGLPTTIYYGATDSSGTSANRTVTITYDTVFPGRIATTSRTTDLGTGTAVTANCFLSTCSASCASPTDNQLCTVTQSGNTLDATGTVVSFSNKITYVHDTKGRISEIDGAVSGLKTTFDFFTSTDPNKDQFLQDYKAYKDGTNFLEPQVIAYDFWGHPTGLQAPDGNITCDTYDTARGFLSQRRRAMNGQTDCTTSNALDIKAIWARDSWLRLTQVTRPDGSCMFYAYDSSGRLSTTKRRDDCNASSSGDYQSYSYTADSQVSEIDTYNASSTLTAKQPFTYFDSRRLQEIVNPVDTAKFTGLVYDDAGRVTEVDGASSLSKTVNNLVGAPGRDNRVTSVDRYRDATNKDTWSLIYDWLSGQSQVTDGDSKVTGSVRDDVDRLVKITSPDISHSTVRVYDSASRLTTVVEDQGDTSQQTHSFTFDYLSRPLNDDFQGTCSTGTPQPEIQRAYDALPAGITCPTGVTCNNLTGRLAYVKAQLMCSSAYRGTDGSLDQETFFSYDKAGRLVEEYIRDDGGRKADHFYAYTKNGALSQITTPSGAVIGWTFDTAGSNSDADRVTALWRGTSATPVIDTVSWNPYGPLSQYNQENTISSTAVQTLITRNLAYRISDVKQKAGTTTLLDATISEDAMGRVTKRLYTNAATGVLDSYFLYDGQSRVLCETTDSQSTCPTSGADIKNSHSLSPPFTSAGDWKRVLRPIAGSTSGLINDVNTSGTYGTSHQITDVNQSDGTPAFGHTAMAYDVRGNRTYDDNTTRNTNDRRDYTYDARGNVINVRGQYYAITGAWHYYDVASAFDAKNRRVFKSFYDETSLKTATWYFYYDAADRLSEVFYMPDTSASTTYSIFQLFWLDRRLIAYWQTDYPSVTTSKRYVGTDETGRPIDMWNWPSSGDATRVWAINPSAWGFDNNKVGPTVYQPILFAGQYQDIETIAYENDGATIHRPALALNGFRTYDPFVGGYLQLDPMVDKTWSSYGYVNSDPIGSSDPHGLVSMTCHGAHHTATACNDGGDEGMICEDASYDETYDCPDGETPSDGHGGDVAHPHSAPQQGETHSQKWWWKQNQKARQECKNEARSECRLVLCPEFGQWIMDDFDGEARNACLVSAGCVLSNADPDYDPTQDPICASSSSPGEPEPACPWVQFGARHASVQDVRDCYRSAEVQACYQQLILGNPDCVDALMPK